MSEPANRSMMETNSICLPKSRVIGFLEGRIQALHEVFQQEIRMRLLVRN